MKNIASMPLNVDLDFPRDAFSIDNAHACAVASDQAYNESNISNEGTDTQCLIVDAGECVIIAFRGTKPDGLAKSGRFIQKFRDFFTDADIRRVEISPGAKWHNGFWTAGNSVFPEVSNAINACTKPIIVTGHSLGAALARQCAFRLARLGVPIHAVITFGSPNDTNIIARNLYNTTTSGGGMNLGNITFNLVNEEDIVGRIPFSMKRGGRLVFHDSFGRLTFDPGFAYRLASDIFGFWKAYRFGKEDLIADHGMDNYLRITKKLCVQSDE